MKKLADYFRENVSFESVRDFAETRVINLRDYRRISMVKSGVDGETTLTELVRDAMELGCGYFVGVRNLAVVPGYKYLHEDYMNHFVTRYAPSRVTLVGTGLVKKVSEKKRGR